MPISRRSAGSSRPAARGHGREERSGNGHGRDRRSAPPTCFRIDHRSPDRRWRFLLLQEMSQRHLAGSGLCRCLPPVPRGRPTRYESGANPGLRSQHPERARPRTSAERAATATVARWAPRLATAAAGAPARRADRLAGRSRACVHLLNARSPLTTTTSTLTPNNKDVKGATLVTLSCSVSLTKRGKPEGV